MHHQEIELIKSANGILEREGLQAASCVIIQDLWAGYGHICQLKAVSASLTDQPQVDRSLILKFVAPSSSETKNNTPDEGHLRKLISYQVEQYFYTHLAPTMPSAICVAHCFGCVEKFPGVAMILTDLRKDFPVIPGRRDGLSKMQVHAALTWLASFHGFWWKQRYGAKLQHTRLPPLDEAKLLPHATTSPRQGVWLNGGYTYLSTRRTEYKSLMEDVGSRWSAQLCRPISPSNQSAAEMVAAVLSPTSLATSAGYETLIHGDVKSENLFTTSAHDNVAFFDFQYVGLGLGVCDLAKLFTCSVPVELLGAVETGARIGAGEKHLLECYQRKIEEVSGKVYPWDVLEKHWNVALVDWLRFQASWGFWGNTEWLEARVHHILRDQEWMAWLVEATN